jgi:hypothetical protein
MPAMEKAVIIVLNQELTELRRWEPVWSFTGVLIWTTFVKKILFCAAYQGAGLSLLLSRPWKMDGLLLIINSF